MKKLIVLMSVMALALYACGTDDVSDEETPEDSTEETSENGDSSEETDGAASDGSSAGDIIDQATEEHVDTMSYEMAMDTTISSDDDETQVSTVTTHSEQDELKVDIKSPAETVSHYIIDGGHFIYSSGDLSQQEENVDISNTEYSDLLAQLEQYKESSVAENDEGYTITHEVGSPDDIAGLLPEDIAGETGGLDEADGVINLHFNEEYQYTGGDVEMTVNDGDNTYEVTAEIDITDIDNIDVIQKPSGM